MNRDGLRGFLQLGFFIGGCGALMAFMIPPERAEFVLSVCSAAMGFSVVGGALALARWMGDPPESHG